MGNTTGVMISRRASPSGSQNRDALKWAERRRDQAIHRAALEAEHANEANDNEALHANILVHTNGEPRSITRRFGGNGLEAWRKLKSRYDPETEMNQIGAALRALRPAKFVDIKDLFPSRSGKTSSESTRKSQEPRC